MSLIDDDKIVELYHSALFKISEICVDESKCHISSEEAVKQIRKYLDILNKVKYKRDY